MMEIRDGLKESVIAASARSDLRVEVSKIYEELQGEIDQRRPVCVMSGKCCRFEEYGHRLYVTTAELAAFEAALESSKEKVERREDPHPHSRRVGTSLRSASNPPEDQERGKNGGCPFQVGRMCGVHGIRPMGCRVFFCDPAATEWQHEAYERMHRRLKKLHDDLSIPYAYVEWRQACGVMGWKGIGNQPLSCK